MRIYPLDILQALGLAQQIVMNRHFDFTANFQIRVHETGRVYD